MDYLNPGTVAPSLHCASLGTEPATHPLSSNSIPSPLILQETPEQRHQAHYLDKLAKTWTNQPHTSYAQDECSVCDLPVGEPRLKDQGSTSNKELKGFERTISSSGYRSHMSSGCKHSSVEKYSPGSAAVTLHPNRFIKVIEMHQGRRKVDPFSRTGGNGVSHSNIRVGTHFPLRTMSAIVTKTPTSGLRGVKEVSRRLFLPKLRLNW